MQENISRQEKLKEKKKQEARSNRGKTKAAINNPMAIQSKKIKIADEGLCLSDRKKVSWDVVSKKEACVTE